MEKLLKILTELRPDIDFEKEHRLVDDGLLDSFDIVVLVGLLNDEFDISIPIAKITPEYMNSAKTMLELIESL